jgi:uncharacterized protein (UPF0254 family)
MNTIVRPSDLEIEIDIVDVDGNPIDIDSVENVIVNVNASSVKSLQTFSIGSGVNVIDATAGRVSVAVDRDNLNILRVNDIISILVTVVENGTQHFKNSEKFSTVLIENFAKIAV